MASNQPKFSFTLSVVTIAHVLAIACLLAAGASSCIKHNKENKIMPVEFIVAVDDGPETKDFSHPVENDKPPEPEVKEPPKPEPEPIKAVIPEPEKKKEPAKKPEPKKKEPEPKKEPKKEKPPEPKKPEVAKKTPSKKPFEKGRRITMPNANPPPPGMKRLPPSELARLLALGATPGNRNLVPEGDTLYFEIIRRKLYKAWVQPGSVPKQLTAEVEIMMNAKGDILNRRLLKASGNSVMDESVMDAVRSVPQIEGLSDEFIQRKNGRVTVTFELGMGAGGA